MLRFITSLILCFLLEAASAQMLKPMEEGRQPMLRFSVDPTLYARRYFQQADLFGADFILDTEIKQNLFLEAGMGFADVSLSAKQYDYSNQGVYVTLGANLNLTQYQSPQDRHTFYVGLHYGYALISQEVGNIVCSNYWGQVESHIPQEQCATSWVEVALGIKAEAAKNVFIGWSAESRIRTHLSESSVEPIYIAGYGKTTNRISLDFNFWVSYAFSFKPKKKVVSLVNE